MTLLIVVAVACVISLIVSRTFTWAAGKSPFWNMGFAVVLVLIGAVLLLLGVIWMIRRIVPSVN